MSNNLPEVNVELLNDNNTLRKMLVDNLMPGGVVPADAKDVRNILTALKDIDSQQLKIAQIKAEDDNAQSDRDMALQIAKMSEKLSSGANPFATGGQKVSVDAQQLPKVDVVEGEFDDAPGEGKFDDFIARNEDADGNFIGKDK